METTLEKLPVFSGIRSVSSPEAKVFFKRVAAFCRLRSMSTGETLARESEKCASAFVLVQGHVSISVAGEIGANRRVIREAHALPQDSDDPPTVLCVWPALTGEPSRTTITVSEGAQVIEMPERALAEACAAPDHLLAICRACVSGVQNSGQTQLLVDKVSALIERHLQLTKVDQGGDSVCKDGKDGNGHEQIGRYDNKSPDQQPTTEEDLNGVDDCADEQGQREGTPLGHETGAEGSGQAGAESPTGESAGEPDLDLWHPPELDESENIDKQGKQFILNCQSCGRIWMRNARLLQQANRYREAAEAGGKAAYLFRLIVEGDELNQATMDAGAGLHEAETLQRRWALLADNERELAALAADALAIADPSLAQVFPQVATVYGPGRQAAMARRGQRMYTAAMHVLQLRWQMVQGQDKGARLSWCGALFAEGADMLKMAGLRAESAAARKHYRICRGYFTQQRAEHMYHEAMADFDLHRPSSRPSTAGSDAHGWPALHESAIATFREAAAELIFDAEWEQLLTQDEARSAAHRVLQALTDYADCWLGEARECALHVNKDTGVYSGRALEAEAAFCRALALYDEARLLDVCDYVERERITLMHVQVERERMWNRQARVSQQLSDLEKVKLVSLRQETDRVQARLANLRGLRSAGALSKVEYDKEKSKEKASLGLQMEQERTRRMDVLEKVAELQMAMGDTMGSGRTMLSAAHLLGSRYGDARAQRQSLQGALERFCESGDEAGQASVGRALVRGGVSACRQLRLRLFVRGCGGT